MNKISVKGFLCRLENLLFCFISQNGMRVQRYQICEQDLWVHLHFIRVYSRADALENKRTGMMLGTGADAEDNPRPGADAW